MAEADLGEVFTEVAGNVFGSVVGEHSGDGDAEAAHGAA